MAGVLSRHLQALWWRPRLAGIALLLWPLSRLVAHESARRRRAAASAAPLPVPVIVVGNVIVGGAGKTPTVIALVQQLQAWGWRPGIVSRGHGRHDDEAVVLGSDPGLGTGARGDGPLQAARFGDEPMLMHRRTGATVSVGRRRRDAAAALLAARPDVDVLVSDDGLQHAALPRDIEIVVFDGRGLGNGQVLPAGPLRECVEQAWSAPDVADRIPRWALLNGEWPLPPALPWPACAPSPWHAGRALAGAVELHDWDAGRPASPDVLRALHGRRLLAAAGIGEPERFFGMLEAEGLTIDRLPLDDHASFDPLPWDASVHEVVVTEKDAVKLASRPPAHARIWVVTLDFRLPAGLLQAVHEALDAARARKGRA